ncbi:MAG TPA: alpha/beta hydrolase [Chitinophagales bacterium]|nr:alpha/beta hydrolase [Chitinophagales bacterium]
MSYQVKCEQQFKYCEEGDGEAIVLLHGLFGALSNFNHLIQHFSKNYKVIIPLLPLYDLPLDQTTVTGMVDYVAEFINYRGFKKVHLIGNSLGGHIAQLYVLRDPAKVQTMTLTGSSGLFENSLGDTYPRKGSYEYVKKKAEGTFYDPKFATKELVDEVFDIVNDRSKAIRIVVMAKSALRHNLREDVPTMNLPVCLIWGKSDQITPAFVGEEFHKLLPNSELNLMEHCGHAPMMEKPDEFNAILERFLKKHA